MMKKLAFVIGGILLLALACYYFLFLRKETGSKKFAEDFSKAFVENYVDMTYGSDAKDVAFHLDGWKFEKKHYVLNISAGWNGGCCSFLHYVTCDVKVKLKVIVDKHGNIYDYTVTDKNACALEHEVAGVAFKSAVKLTELGYRLKKIFDSDYKQNNP